YYAFFGYAFRFRVAGYLVAHAVGDPLAVDLLEGLHHVGVVADDQVDVGVVQQFLGDLQLVGRWFLDVLGAPVEAGDHHLGAGGRRDGRLLVADRQVGGADRGLHAGQDLAVVAGAFAVLGRLVGDGRVDQHVTTRDHGEAVRVGRGRVQRLRRRCRGTAGHSD